MIGKCWGTTEAQIVSPTFEMHRLVILPNMQCSLHVHRRKWNAFLVITGRLFIDVVKNDYPLTDVTELVAGDSTTVGPGEHHRFRTGSEGCTAVEMYYTDALSDDIERKDHGGPVVAE